MPPGSNSSADVDDVNVDDVNVDAHVNGNNSSFNTSSHELSGSSTPLRLVLRVVGFETVDDHTVFYLQVCVETHGSRTFFVRKRYSQFEALRKELKAAVLSSSIRIPKLPGKRLVNNMEPDFVRERARGLSTFCWSLAGNPDLCALPCVQRFLWSDVEGAAAPVHMQPTTPFLRLAPSRLTANSFALDAASSPASATSAEEGRFNLGPNPEALRELFAREGLDLAEMAPHDDDDDAPREGLCSFLPSFFAPAPPSPSTPPRLSSSAESDMKPRATPMPSLRIVILLVGSRGDVQPYVALGKALKAKGHVVRIAAHSVFREWITEQHQLGFAPIAGDPKELLKMVVENHMFSYAFVKNGFDNHRPWVLRVLKDAWIACTQEDPFNPHFPQPNLSRKVGPGFAFASLESSFRADLVIANPPSFAGWHVAEALGVPLIMSFPMPWSRTGEFPSPFTSVSSTPSRSLNWLSFGAVDRLIWLGIGDLVNRWRVEDLWLPPIWTLSAKGHRYIHDYKVPWLYPWSPAVLPKPSDWPSHICVSGNWILQDSDGNDWAPPPDLDAFLGKRPVFIGFGSIVVPDPERLSSIIQGCADMLVGTGRHVLVQPGWAGVKMQAGHGVRIIGPAPHAHIFGRCSAVVHHGGSGTTAEGLRCGKPTVIVPFFGDQFFWGDTVKSRGLGETASYVGLTATKLFEAVLRALNPDIQVRCDLCKEQMLAEDGIAKALDFIERHVFPDGPLVTNAPLPKPGEVARRVHDDEGDWRFWPFYDLKKKVKVERYENPSGFRKVKGRVKLFLSPASALDLVYVPDEKGVEMQELEGADKTVPAGHTSFSWVGTGPVPKGHTRFSWGGV